MKVGMNDPCPCGSGKKYKKCCFYKESMSDKSLIYAIVNDSGYDESLASVLSNVNDYIKEKQLRGACHSSSSVLYVALSELGYRPSLMIGEVSGDKMPFDHSWIELDGEIIDLAINYTMDNGRAASEQIVLGNNIRFGTSPNLEYGVTYLGLNGEALQVYKMPFVEYMDKYPYEKNGLWTVVQRVLDNDVEIKALRDKYKDTERTYKQSPSWSV